MRHPPGRAALSSPLGLLEFLGENGRIVSLRFAPKRRTRDQRDYKKSASPSRSLRLALKQINDYFEGRRVSFDLPLALKGTPFQKKVWQRLMKIPYGHTKSYRELAESMGSSRAARACAGACAKNPLPIIVPCHRVIHADGVISGYTGGTWRKAWLLSHERGKKSPRPHAYLLRDG